MWHDILTNKINKIFIIMVNLLNSFLTDDVLNSLDSLKKQTFILNDRIEIPVPGLTKEDVTIKIKNRLIHISYTEDSKNPKRFIQSFVKMYTLSNDVDIDNISGSVTNGVLSIHLPKLKESVNERKLILN